ncbi:hypothetical protein P389DRAFT_192072 [Cystobasidium minutum MCA 4210]|uniref:uncharacterized protein n=1 Tax=Cystobasidium minutum MCA 4210 TaxID=1397322 RepID=UPI0034CDA21E|eukprot:jgi/Rhomi1/192072/gm1.286_g
MEVDDKVMPHAGNTEGNESGVVVPRGEGADHIKVKEREGLAELPVAPVNGPEEGTAKGDALMEEVEDAKEEQKANAEDDGAAADEDDDDLFGDEGEDDEEEQDKKPAERQDSAAAASGEERDGDDLSEAELERRRRLEYEEEDAPALEEQKVEYAQVRLPKIPLASQTQKLHHAKLPNFLHLESAAFHPSTYNSEEEPKNLPVENIIRWRWRPEDPSNPSAPPQKQTNARVIRWNDGSMSLQLGSEIFDIATDRTVTGKSVPPTSATGMSSQGGSDSSTYLVAQHGYVGLLETQALVTGNLTFRPTTIQSTSHRKIASSFAAQQQRKGKTVMIQAADDPEAAKAALERKAKAAKKPRAAKGEGSGAARKSGRRSMRSTNLADWSDNDVLTDEEMDAATDKSRAAERRARRDRERAEMEDFLASESDEDGEGAEDDDEDEDDTDKRRKGRKRDEDMDIADDLDEMEAQAEQVARAERSKKKKAKGSSAAAPQDIDSDDVDKSEDEGFVRKKLVIESDEE